MAHVYQDDYRTVSENPPPVICVKKYYIITKAGEDHSEMEVEALASVV